MIVAITGGDGAGKSIVAEQIVARLAALGFAARRVDRWDILTADAYPSARFLRGSVDELRVRLFEVPKTPRFLFLLWTMALALSGHEPDWPEPGAIVLDGYWMKHAASEAVYGMDPRWIEAVVAGLPPAQIVLHLRLDPHLAWQRKRGHVTPYECGMDPSCLRDSFVAHQTRIMEQLDAWSTAGGWVAIDAAAPLPSVVAAGVDAILARLPR
jgi:dTMP kinase